MGKPTKSTTPPLIYSFDAGNGSAKGISTEIEVRGIVQFEPLIAPISDKRGLERGEEKPLFSLQIEEFSTLVFGVADVYTHGKRSAARRLNSMSRYTNPDYFRLLDVLYLHTFASWRGNSEYITPTGVISLPVSQFLNDQTRDAVQETLIGKRTLVDYDGCELRLEIQENRLIIMPESYGALMHWLYDPKLLARRSDSDSSGTTAVIDVGFETTDCSLFVGTKYQRDQAFTIARAGMGNVIRQLEEWSRQSVKGADASWIDAHMHNIAGQPPGTPKCIEVAQGQTVDIQPRYDDLIEELAARIIQGVETAYNEAPTRYLLAGGGAFHLGKLIETMTVTPVITAPDADAANVIGAFTGLKLKAQGK